MILLNNTTSTGASAGYSLPAGATLAAMQVTRASTAAVATSVTLQGSLDGANWFNLGAAQTFQSTGVSIYVSTGSYATGWLRANVGAHSATGPISVAGIAV